MTQVRGTIRTEEKTCTDDTTDGEKLMLSAASRCGPMHAVTYRDVSSLQLSPETIALLFVLLSVLLLIVVVLVVVLRSRLDNDTAEVVPIVDVLLIDGHRGCPAVLRTSIVVSALVVSAAMMSTVSPGTGAYFWLYCLQSNGWLRAVVREARHGVDLDLAMHASGFEKRRKEGREKEGKLLREVTIGAAVVAMSQCFVSMRGRSCRCQSLCLCCY